MLFLLLFWSVVLMIAAFAVWPIIDKSRGEAGKSAKASPKAASAGGTEPESLEGVLVSRLSSGLISRGQYTRAMEGIAARDDERHPLTVPPDAGSPA
ncbi:hypothetical protein BJ973_000254 [Actinoplanes tereljensis]|uniref:Uncharacterized protein n=1 Tax=Paractinoplanes tereljensis TaxID=571912 RepID=A0A919TVJ1_9ACTN|nr:hypothetical protein [Actinoplanes tereljensis]GIF23389.1 hypothetical protein Ate02nite_61190 [Actinoplanes tereljensis]